MEIELKRNKDGTVEGITTMGDLITLESEKPKTEEELESEKLRKELEEKYGDKDPYQVFLRKRKAKESEE